MPKSEEMLLEACGGTWGSVRKVRYKEDIYSIIRYANETERQEFSSEGLRKAILAGRSKRLALIQKHYKSSLYSPVAPGSEGTKLSITLSDSLAFFKRLGLITLVGKELSPTRLSRNLAQVLHEDQLHADVMIAKAVMESGYLAYSCWLRRLDVTEEIRIPTSLSGRHPQLRAYLEDNGFRTDVASFYTIRDLFYELELCNWMVDDQGNEHVYSTSLLERTTPKDWEHVETLANGYRLAIRKIISRPRFLKALRSAYLAKTRDRFGVEADLLAVRDVACLDLRISDQQCRDLLIETASANPSEFNIRLNFGSVFQKRRNYGLKVSTLPTVSSTRFATFIRLDVAR